MDESCSFTDNKDIIYYISLEILCFEWEDEYLFPVWNKRGCTFCWGKRTMENTEWFLLLPPATIARCNLTRQINFNIFPIMLTSFISLFITAIEAKQVVIYGRNLPINYYPYDLTIPAVFILDLLIMWILCLYPAVSNIKRS